MEVKPWIALVCWPRAVENLSAGRAKNARKAMECPSSTRSRGCSVRGMTGASVADTDGASGEDTAMSSRVWVADGIGAGLVVSLTGASLVAMMDNFTPGPASEASPTQASTTAEPASAVEAPVQAAAEADFREELLAAGVPEHLHDWLAEYGIGALVVKMGIRFLEMSPERCVATMPVEGNTQVAGILHGGAHVVLAETLGSFAAGMHAGPGRQALGIEVGATHHRAVSAGTVTGTCTAIHLGRTLTTHEIVMTDEQGRRLSTARITNLIRTRGRATDQTSGAIKLAVRATR